MRYKLIALTIFLAPATSWAAPDGKALYTVNCQSCHGPKGLGDGPDAVYMDSKPGNLSAATYKKGTSDKAVQKIIVEGIPGMTGFADKLKADEIKALVGYLKELRGGK
jgi:mono/diheme cytochrome c family protein